MINTSPRNKAPIATETQEQIALVKWASLTNLPGNDKKVGDYLFHIPNQGKRSLRLGYEFTKLGLKKGIPDLMFAYPVYGEDDAGNQQIMKAGLFIEMKRRIGSKVSKEQKEFMGLMESVGYSCVVAYGWEHGRDAILEYLR